MSLIALIILPFGMSMDAFSVAIAKGTAARGMTLTKAVKHGLVFGVVEAIAPVIGWLMGKVAHQWMESVDHWIGFVLLMILGIRCIYEAIWGDEDDEASEARTGIWLLITAIATSIDAMVVGVSLAFLEVNIWLSAALIGFATTIMATMGLYFGRRLGERFGKGAMIAGGVVLMVIGSSILYNHLTA